MRIVNIAPNKVKFIFKRITIIIIITFFFVSSTFVRSFSLFKLYHLTKVFSCFEISRNSGFNHTKRFVNSLVVTNDLSHFVTVCHHLIQMFFLALIVSSWVLLHFLCCNSSRKKNFSLRQTWVMWKIFFFLQCKFCHTLSLSKVWVLLQFQGSILEFGVIESFVTIWFLSKICVVTIWLCHSLSFVMIWLCPNYSFVTLWV